MTNNKLTQKKENFTLNIFKGMTHREAYVKAGYASNYAIEVMDTNASMLANSNKILIRLKELRGEVKADTIADVTERQEILTEIARGNLIDYQTPTGIHIDADSPNQRAIEGLEVVTMSSRDSQAGTITIKRPVVSESIRNGIFERYNNKCALCSSTDNLQLDHIVALSKGGRTVEENLQPLCEDCNRAKGASKKSQAFTVTKLKLHNRIAAIAELSKMDGVYTTQVSDAQVVVNSFTFILPDGTKVTPKQLVEVNNGQERTDEITSTALQRQEE